MDMKCACDMIFHPLPIAINRSPLASGALGMTRAFSLSGVSCTIMTPWHRPRSAWPLLPMKWRKNGTMGKKVSPSRAHVDVGCFLSFWAVKLLWDVLKRYDEFPALLLVLAIVLRCRWNPDVRSTRWELRLSDSTAMFHRLGVVFCC